MPDLDLPTINVTLSAAGAQHPPSSKPMCPQSRGCARHVARPQAQSTQIVDGQVHIQVKLFIGRNISDALNEARTPSIRSAPTAADLDPPIITSLRSDSTRS